MVFIILKNDTYGALRWFAGVFKAKDPPGLGVPGLDFCVIAKGYEVKAAHTDTRDSFEVALRIAPDANGPIAIEVSTLTIQPH